MHVDATQQHKYDHQAYQRSVHGEPYPRVEWFVNTDDPLHRHGHQNPRREIQRGVEDEEVQPASEVGDGGQVELEDLLSPVSHGTQTQDDAVVEGQHEHVQQGARLPEVQALEDDDDEEVA